MAVDYIIKVIYLWNLERGLSWWRMMTKGEGVKKYQNFDDVICERALSALDV